MKFLILTNQFDEKLRINFAFVFDYYRLEEDTVTTVRCSGQNYLIKETPEDIDWMLASEKAIVSIGTVGNSLEPKELQKR